MKEIVKYLYNEKPNIVDGGHGPGKNSDRKGDIKAFVEHILNKLPDNKAYLICQAAYSPGKAIFFTEKVGQIFSNKENLQQCLFERGGKIAHYMYFDNKQCAINAKLAMQRPLLRFALYKVQSDQNLTPSKCYRYIPNIDWEDNRAKTDEGILELCGCPKNKCKEYVEYCKKIIENVDNKRK